MEASRISGDPGLMRSSGADGVDVFGGSYEMKSLVPLLLPLQVPKDL